MSNAKVPHVPASEAVIGEPTTIGERIVLAEDGGAAGRAAVRWVTERLGRRPADVRVIGTVARADDAAAVADSWKTVDRATDVLHTVAPNASVAADVVVGDPEESLRAEAEAADLLVIGLSETDVGEHDSLPVRLAGRATCVVVIVPADWAPAHGGTVVGVSIDTASDAALEFAANHARREGAPLHLVHAWNLPATGELPFPEDRTDESIPDVQRHALEAFAAGVRTADLEVTSAARQGSPAEVLWSAAGEADLLVVGRRTRRPLARLLLGSVSRALAEDPPCPIAVVPQPRTPLQVVKNDRRDSGL